MPKELAADHLDRFVEEAASRTCVVALLADTWGTRLDVMDAGVGLDVAAHLYAGTSFDTARTRLFGPGVRDSCCIACGSERAREPRTGQDRRASRGRARPDPLSPQPARLARERWPGRGELRGSSR